MGARRILKGLSQFPFRKTAIRRLGAIGFLLTWAMLAGSPSVRAADRFWKEPFSGQFGDISNWTATPDGIPSASVPGPGDYPRFIHDGTYTVTFAAAATNQLLELSDGNVTFDLGGFTYTVTNSGLIGNQDGQTSRLTLRNGILAGDANGNVIQLGRQLTPHWGARWIPDRNHRRASG